ncbi:MAG: PEP-CTERM sorting domain-containing protein [Planctomycetes bacterium]|nr:PEP-CTERM sorting domain-containing protein [Planctomycetota bacterium]MBL7039190.1 PEP-CTERM sorting domain-containing protein [Pirellulaceae bacterium]
MTRARVCLMLGGLLFAFEASSACADLIVFYESTNADGGLPATTIASGVSALDLSRGSGIFKNTTGSTYNSRDWTDAGTIDGNDYLQWGWSDATVPFNLTDLDIRYDRSDKGPKQLEIRLSTNGGAFQSVFSDSSVDVNDETHLDIDLTGFTNVTSATFRLYAFDAESASGTFDIENDDSISNGSVDGGIAVSGASVPEPSVLILTLLGAAIAGGSRLMRRSKVIVRTVL